MHGYRLSAAPDFLADEGLYFLPGRNLASGAGLLGDRGVFFWHPPVYFLVEAVYIKLAGLLDDDVVTALYSVRWLNVSFSAATAGLLVLFGRKLHSYKAGLLMAGIFVLDPYVQRINRRGMLETLAMLFTLIGLYIFFTRRQGPTRWQQLGAGVAFGLAILTKEPMALELLAVLGFAAWSGWARLRDAVHVAAIASLVYLVYPIWAVAIGQGDSYFRFRSYGLGRFFSLLKGADWQPPGIDVLTAAGLRLLNDVLVAIGRFPSHLLGVLGGLALVILLLRFRHRAEARYLAIFGTICCGLIGFSLVGGTLRTWFFSLRTNRSPPLVENVLTMLSQYLMSYLVIVLGVLFTAILVLRFRHRAEARYLAMWSVVSYGFIGFGLTFGKISDHFFYYVILPAIAVVGYVLAALLESAASPLAEEQDRIGQPLRGPGWPVRAKPVGVRLVLPVSALLVMSLYNGYQWLDTYGRGVDNSYARIYRYVRENVPPGETISVGSDVSNYLFSPDYVIQFHRNPKSVTDEQVRYFILSSKDSWGPYHSLRREFYDWVMQETRPLIEAEGVTFWKLGLYYRDVTPGRAWENEETRPG